jgi:hypothetical protein
MARGPAANKPKKPAKATKARTRMALPRPRGVLGFTVPEAGKMVGLSVGSAYKAAHAGEIPTVKIGALLIVPRAAWLRKLGVEDPDQTEPSEPEPVRDPCPGKSRERSRRVAGREPAET